ncbi:flagellar motor protein MotB [Desulfuromonas sp. KJ2020]|uniref:flagellar motor protein MotB n=1 Tax=Desulfuromonas sp. KJ2020 TaxID=2919173 RepID=UPI0020A72B1E|nr:flagellar motor protein MotB [Desulfuromonas sp. KJ2020]
MAKKPKKKQEGAPAWMVTYSDLVTLLLTFFVLLLSMASMDRIKFSAASNSLKGAFGIMGGKQQTEIAPPAIIDFSPIDDDMFQRVYKRILEQLNRLRLDKTITLVKDRGAIVLRVNEAILFDVGQTEVKPAAYPVLRKVADMVRPLPMQLRVEGHTDDVPVASGQRTNWDISVQRAVSVLKFLQQEDLFPLDRMAAVGYGEQKPLAPNDSDENRALNRRVEFVLESMGKHQEKLPYLIDAKDQMPF